MPYDDPLAYALATERERDWTDTAGAIANELVKSYGFARTSEGDWEWKAENIAKVAKEEPIWSFIDWATLAFPVLRWGSAVRAVSKGVGAVGKGFKAGEFAGKLPTGFGAKATAMFVGPEKAAAAQAFIRGPGRIFGGRLSNPITTQVDAEYLKLVDRYGAEAWEQRGIAKALRREQTIEAAMREREAADLIRGFDRAKLSKYQLSRVSRFLSEGVGPTDDLVTRTLKGNEKAQDLYRKTWEYRNAVHEASYDLNLISKKTYLENLREYNPALYRETEGLLAAIDELAGVSPGQSRMAKFGAKAAQGQERFMQRFRTRAARPIPGAEQSLAVKEARLAEAQARGATEKELKALDWAVREAEMEAQYADEYVDLTRIFDPRVTLSELSRAGQIIAKQRYAQRLAGSVLAQDAASIAARVGEIVQAADIPAAKRLAKLHGIKARQVKPMREVWARLQGFHKKGAVEELAQAAGWKRLDSLFEQGKMPAYVRRLPKELREKWIDPVAADDVLGTLKFLDDNGTLINLYKKGISFFRASKTAYNPATHVRNMVGAWIFHHLAVGGVPKPVPLRGLKSLRDLDEGYVAARRAGIIGSSFDAEIREALLEGAGQRYAKRKLAGQATAVDWMGESVAAKWTQAGASKAERFYRAIDEVYKLDAFLTLRARYMKEGGYAWSAARGNLEGILSGLPKTRGIKPSMRLPDGRIIVSKADDTTTHVELLEELYAGRHGSPPIKGQSWDDVIIQLSDADDFGFTDATHKYINREEAFKLFGKADSPDLVPGAMRPDPKAVQAALKAKSVDSFLAREVDRIASEKAVLEVNKFMPSFMSHSDLTNAIRKHIPFASFTTEALRVWKNALVEKPHLAFFWNHVIDSSSMIFGTAAGYSPDQVQEAQAALPYYLKNKKTMVLPFNVDGQPRFVDFSYLIPLANIVEAETSEKMFFEMMDPTTNPLLNLAAAAATTKDPFSGREIEPRFTERQLGIPVTGNATRWAIGLVEHMATTMLPPLVPPGYAGVNLLEATRGQMHPETHEPLEDGVLRTILANVAGFRLYAPDVESQVLNIRHEQRERNERMTQAWQRWEFARANDDPHAMEEEKGRILALRMLGGHEDAEDYFAKSVKRREPFASLSTKQLKEVKVRARKLGDLSPRDERVRKKLRRRLSERTNK